MAIHAQARAPQIIMKVNGKCHCGAIAYEAIVDPEQVTDLLLFGQGGATFRSRAVPSRPNPALNRTRRKRLLFRRSVGGGAPVTSNVRHLVSEPSMWSFAEIEIAEPHRALALENAPPADLLLAGIVDKFRHGCVSGALRLGMEQSEQSSSDLRAVLQFHVGETLSDQFFNSKSGYRAHFRQGWTVGLSYNEALIAAVRMEVQSRLPEHVEVRHLTPRFDDCGVLHVSRSDIFTSLDPALSKVWFCARLISPNGRICQLPTGAVGPRLVLQDGTWAAVSRDESDAWLDIKGAFLGSDRLYQPKDPIFRAKKLQASGEA